MNRREFGELSTAAALSSTWLLAAAQDLGGAKRTRFSVMLWALEKQAPFDTCVEWAAQAGYQGIELVGEFQSWSKARRAEVMARMRSLGMVFDAMSGVKAGFAVPDEAEAFRTQFLEQMTFAKELECSHDHLAFG